MKPLALDHVNIRTQHLSELKRFYSEVVGLTEGIRPSFGFGGAWMYAGGQAIVHLVEVNDPPTMVSNPSLQHFAIRATGLQSFLSRLVAHKVEHRVSLIPDFGTRQVNLRDPDGNHLHVDFDASEPFTAPG